MSDADKKSTNEKPIPPIHLSFDEVIGDVLKIKPPPKANRIAKKRTQKSQKTKTR